MTSAHSLLSPSSASTWRYCAAYPSMVKLYPGEESEDAKEGTAAHWVAWRLSDGVLPKEGELAPNGVMVTQEMIDGAELLISAMYSMASPGEWNVEEPVVIFDDLDCWGTPDGWSYCEVTRTLRNIDYKFGHRFVDEYENDQGILYIKGLIDLIQDNYGIYDQDLNVEFTIVQPRCFYRGEPVRTWRFKACDIRGHINMLRMAAERALDVDPVATTNPGCRDCPARHDCPALQKATCADIETSTQSTPINITAHAAAVELKMLERARDRMDARITGLQEFVLSKIRSGERVPHYQVLQGYGRRAWNVAEEEVIALGLAFEKDLSKRSVITPSQAIKLGIDESVIKEYSHTPLGKLSLAPQENPNKLFSQGK